MTAPDVPDGPSDDRFNEVLALIHGARQQAIRAVNTQLIELYWQVGAYISRKLERVEWGDSVVGQLAEHLAKTQPGCAVSLGQICSACASSTRFTTLRRKSRHWCDNYPGRITWRDFALDLLFFHRGLNCLVAIELKVGRFEPEHLGKLGFYLEALDRDERKPHENPAIGVLLCASKDDEVVEYALNRSLSPALIAEYQVQLPDKQLLQAKLHEFYALNVVQAQEC